MLNSRGEKSKFWKCASIHISLDCLIFLKIKIISILSWKIYPVEIFSHTWRKEISRSMKLGQNNYLIKLLQLCFTFMLSVLLIEIWNLKTFWWLPMMITLIWRLSILDFLKLSAQMNQAWIHLEPSLTSLQKFFCKSHMVRKLISGPLVLSHIFFWVEFCHSMTKRIRKLHDRPFKTLLISHSILGIQYPLRLRT